MQQETKGETMNRIEEAYRKQARLIPNLSTSATMPSVNNAMVIAEVRMRAQTKLGVGRKQQAPTPQAHIPGMRDETSVSIGVAQGNNRIGVGKTIQVHLGMADHTHRKARHQQCCVARKPGLNFRNLRFLCQQFSFLLQNNLPTLWENRDRYQIPAFRAGTRLQ